MGRPLWVGSDTVDGGGGNASLWSQGLRSSCGEKMGRYRRTELPEGEHDPRKVQRCEPNFGCAGNGRVQTKRGRIRMDERGYARVHERAGIGFKGRCGIGSLTRIKKALEPLFWRLSSCR